MRKLPPPKLTATYEQRQAFIEFLINKRIVCKDKAEIETLEFEIGQQVEYRGPEQFPDPPPAAKLLAEVKLDLPPQVDDSVPTTPPVPDPWPGGAEEDPGGDEVPA